MEQQKKNSGPVRVFDAPTIFRDVLKSWWLALLVGLITAMITYTVAIQTASPTYSTYTTVVASYTDSKTTVYNNWSAANTLARAFSQVLNSNVMKQKMMEAAGTTDYDSTITATLVENTNLITLQVTSDSPMGAYLSMNAVLENYREVTDVIMSNIVVSVLKSPSVPYFADVTSGVGPVETTALAALLGVLIVLALQGVISYMRDTVKNEGLFSEQVDGTLLSTIYHERKYKTLRAFFKHKKVSVLLTNPNISFGLVETYKILRTKVEYQMRKTGAKVLLVSSVLENEGKSTVSANLALCLAQKGYRIILVDADMRKPALYKVFERDVERTHPLRDVARGKLEPEDVTFSEEEYGLKVLFGRKSCSDSTDIINSVGMKQLIADLKARADYVIIDMPPMSLFSDVECMAQLVDASLLVVGQNTSLVRDINDCIDLLSASKSDFLGCVFNNVRTGGLLGQFVQGGGYHHSGYGRRYGYGYGYRYGYGYGYRYGYGHYGNYGYYGYGYHKSHKSKSSKKDDNTPETPVKNVEIRHDRSDKE